METPQNLAIKFLIAPEDYLPEYIIDARSIYKQRRILKGLLLEDRVLDYLLDILLKAANEGVRFRTLDCLKVIKAILRNNRMATELSDETVSKLFQLFKTFIFNKNKEVQACANLLIRFQTLDDNSVGWLISNWDKSEHILNRLLRYPKKHSLISEWAISIYKKGQLKNRQSEIIALLIDESMTFPQ